MPKLILKHTFIFAVFVFLAQVFGLVRDLYLTRVFGVGQVLDTYYMAFKIPDFLNIFYSVFLGSVIFIPLLTAAKNENGETDNRKAIVSKVNTVGSLVLVLLLIFFLILFIGMPYFANFIAPAWGVEQKEMLINLSRILLFAQFFFPIGILAGCLGMVYEKPVGMAVSGFIYNIFILGLSIILVPIFGIYGLAYSVVIAAIFYMLVQIYPKVVREILFKFKFKFEFLEWKKFIYKNLGRFFAVVAYQVYGVVILALAGLGGSGGVSSFSIAYNIYLAAFFVLGASFSTALMPKISRHHVRGESIEQKKNLRRALIYTFGVSFVAGVLIFFLSRFIISTLYHFSALTVSQEVYIATLLSMLANSFPFFNVLEVIRKYLYSTSQILLAGGVTTLLLFSVLVFTYLLKVFTTKPVIVDLIFGMNISLFLTTLIILIILKIKDQI